MEFGSVALQELEKTDFTLPPDAGGNVRVLRANPKPVKPRVFVGCAKWGRPEWVGTIYPEGTKEQDFLSHYARHFNAIELNATFYRLPRPQQVSEWKSKVGTDFKFCPKLNNKITHIKRLKDAGDLTRVFLEGVEAFKENLGPTFIQTPPNYATKNLEFLEQYLQSLPKFTEPFVELRHPGWYADAGFFEKTCKTLEDLQAGLVVTDTAGRRDCVHMRLTTPRAFIRFVGNGLHPSDYLRLDLWVQRIKQWIDAGIQDLYFFMHQNDELHSPVLCQYVINQINRHCGLSLREPVFIAAAPGM